VRVLSWRRGGGGVRVGWGEVFGWVCGGGFGGTISHYKLSFWAAASAQRALAAAVRARPPTGRARPSPLRIKKALASKW
jgi:hypothetical protein